LCANRGSVVQFHPRALLGLKCYGSTSRVMIARELVQTPAGPTKKNQALEAQGLSTRSNAPGGLGSIPNERAMEKLVIVIRSDIHPGLQLAQTGHAAVRFGARHHEIATAWDEAECNIVCLGARDLGHLTELCGAVAHAPSLVTFREPYLNDEMTSFAVDGAFVPPQWSSLPLALKAHRTCYPAECVDNPGL
jgi:hypothetical protein